MRLRTQRVPRSKRLPLRLYKTTLLISHKTKIAVCDKIHKNAYKQREHQVENLNVKPGVMYSKQYTLLI